MSHERRATLHRNDLLTIETWLKLDGWEVQEPKGSYEVVRAKKEKRWFIAYDRHRGDHFTVQDNMMGVVAAFLRWKKQNEQSRTL